MKFWPHLDLKLDKQVFVFKIIFISRLFGWDIPFILNELESKEKLRKCFNISEVLSADQGYKIFHFKTQKIMKALNCGLNSRNRVKVSVIQTLMHVLNGCLL